MNFIKLQDKAEINSAQHFRPEDHESSQDNQNQATD